MGSLWAWGSLTCAPKGSRKLWQTLERRHAMRSRTSRSWSNAVRRIMWIFRVSLSWFLCRSTVRSMSRQKNLQERQGTQAVHHRDFEVEVATWSQAQHVVCSRGRENVDEDRASCLSHPVQRAEVWWQRGEQGSFRQSKGKCSSSGEHEGHLALGPVCGFAALLGVENIGWLFEIPLAFGANDVLGLGHGRPGQFWSSDTMGTLVTGIEKQPRLLSNDTTHGMLLLVGTGQLQS